MAGAAEEAERETAAPGLRHAGLGKAGGGKSPAGFTWINGQQGLAFCGDFLSLVVKAFRAHRAADNHCTD